MSSVYESHKIWNFLVKANMCVEEVNKEYLKMAICNEIQRNLTLLDLYLLLISFQMWLKWGLVLSWLYFLLPDWGHSSGEGLVEIHDCFCIWFVLWNHLLFQYLNVWDLVRSDLQKVKNFPQPVFLELKFPQKGRTFQMQHFICFL